MHAKSTNPNTKRPNADAKQLHKALLDSVIHELRTSLTSIKLSVTALLGSSDLCAAQHDEFLVVINEETDRLNHLVAEAMDCVQAKTGMTLDLKPHAIEEIIHAATNECRNVLGQRSVAIRIRRGLPPTRADLNRAKKAVAHLLEAALCLLHSRCTRLQMRTFCCKLDQRMLLKANETV
jgi:two-component system sensor histidine kinase KdpD